MLPYSQVTTGMLALMAVASAQDAPQIVNPERVPGAIKHAGIYHVATGTWTRTGSATGNFGPDTIYSNTAVSGYFTTNGGNGGNVPGSENFDEGGIPSSTNTNHPGDRELYTVNCIEIGYCDLNPAGVSGWELSFYGSYDPCTFDDSADHRLDTGPMPANGCWTIAFDLVGREFCLAADGGDGFDDDERFDSFGWSFRYTGDAPSTSAAGFLLTGDPQATDPSWVIGDFPKDGTNTYFGPASLCSPDIATGLLTQDRWFAQDPNDPDPGGPVGTSYCYWFGGYSNNNGCGGPSNPYASFYLGLQAYTSPCDPEFDLSIPNGCASNPNSTGVSSSMVVTGTTSVAANDVTLTASIPVDSFGFFITAEAAGFLPTPGGSSGNLCLEPSGIGRFSNLATSSGAAGIIEISTASGQWSLDNIPRGSGPYAAVAGGSAHFQLWHRDVGPAGPTSNFTDGVVVTWTP